MSRKSSDPKVTSICLFAFALFTQFWPLGNSAAALGPPETSLQMFTAQRRTHGDIP